MRYLWIDIHKRSRQEEYISRVEELGLPNGKFIEPMGTINDVLIVRSRHDTTRWGLSSSISLKSSLLPLPFFSLSLARWIFISVLLNESEDWGIFDLWFIEKDIAPVSRLIDHSRNESPEIVIQASRTLRRSSCLGRVARNRLSRGDHAVPWRPWKMIESHENAEHERDCLGTSSAN